MSSTFGFGGQPATAQKKTLNPVWFLVAIVAAVVLAGVWAYACAPKVHGAEPVGRPDPTGQGRYEQFGPELPHQGAQVVAKLPDGATECGSADELIGASVWNSTREGRAVFSKLTDKATVSVAGKRLFLCRCAKGYNELFLIERPSPKMPMIPQVVKDETPATPTQVAQQGPMGPKGDAGLTGPQGPAGEIICNEAAVRIAEAAQPAEILIDPLECVERMAGILGPKKAANYCRDVYHSGGKVMEKMANESADATKNNVACGGGIAGGGYVAGGQYGIGDVNYSGSYGLEGLRGPRLNSDTGRNIVYHSGTFVRGTPPAIGGTTLTTGNGGVYNGAPGAYVPGISTPIGNINLPTGDAGVFTSGRTPGPGNPGLTGTPLNGSTGR